MEITQKSGTAIEVRQLTETRVSGGGGGKNSSPISTSVRHFCNCRVNWDDGQISFHKFSINCSEGDRVALILADGRPRAEVNSAVGESSQFGFTVKGEDWAIYAASLLGFYFSFFLGIAVIAFASYRLWNRSKIEKEEIAQYVRKAGLLQARQPDLVPAS